MSHDISLPPASRSRSERLSFHCTPRPPSAGVPIGVKTGGCHQNIKMVRGTSTCVPPPFRVPRAEHQPGLRICSGGHRREEASRGGQGRICEWAAGSRVRPGGLRSSNFVTSQHISTSQHSTIDCTAQHSTSHHSTSQHFTSQHSTIDCTHRAFCRGTLTPHCNPPTTSPNSQTIGQNHETSSK